MPGPDREEGGIRDTLLAAGQVGSDLLAVDWERTPLGPPERWTQSLQTVVSIVLTSRFAMWMAWGPELTFFCNDAYRRDTLGTKYPWALGRRADEVWAEIWPDIGPRIEQVMRTGAATWDEALMLFLERGGFREETYHTFSYSPLRDDDGAISGMLCVVSEESARVIGERRMAMLRDLGADPTSVRSESEAIEVASRHLANNLHSLPFTLTYIFDEDGRTARLRGTSGIPPGHPAAPEVLRRDDPGAMWPFEDLAEGMPKLIELDGRFPSLPTGAWEEPPVHALLVDLPHQGQARPLGFLVAALNRYAPLEDSYRAYVTLAAGQVAVGIASARAYEAERTRAETLAELDRAKTTFFTNVSHELRTPLTLLLGPAEDALRDDRAPLPDPQRDRMEVIARNAARLLKLVNTLLDFSRLQSDQAAPQLEAVDLGRYTAELSAMFDSAVARAGLELAIECPPLPAPVEVDREMWAKIVLNLVSNALKFTFEGRITVALAVDGDMARLDVNDTGVGISDADQGRLFERFHRVVDARSRSHEGTGIGLALVAELAEAHGGTVGVSSVPGRGSRFTVHVPMAHEHAAPTAPADVPVASVAAGYVAEAMRWLDDRPEPATTGAGTDDRPLVLVADDNADMREYLTSLLADEYRVATAQDGAVALERARELLPDLVLTDVMMPRLDGFGLLAALHDDPRTAGVPVVMVSARAGEDGTIEGLEAGADDYLVKPFAARELLARVRANLELDRVRRTRDQLQTSRALLDQAQRLAGVGSWEIDLASRRLRGSEELLRQVGVTADELHDLGFGALERLVDERDADRVRTLLQHARDTGEALDFEVRFRTRPGRLYRALAELERDADGAPARLRGSSQDITEQRAAEEALAAISAEREAAAREREIAHELQRSLLPTPSVDPAQLEVATSYQAGVEGTEVGGDWYDVIELGAGRTALVIGDVMGRGVAAAAVMAQMSAAVRAYARLDLPPADVLEHLDDLVRGLGDEQIVTCVYAVFDPHERCLTFANAGHLPPLVAEPGGGVRRLSDGAGPPLGSGPVTMEESSELLSVGARLVLYTDGLVERRDRPIDAGIDELARTLARHEGGIRTLPAALVAALVPDAADDDVALLVASVRESADEVTASLPVRPEPGAVQVARAFVAQRLGDWGAPTDLARDAVLLVSELVSNAILHGRPPIELRLRRTAADVLVEVDDGATVLPRKLRPTPEDEHGRGLVIASLLADRWGTRPLRDGKSVWCLFSLERYAA
ncbi:MAG TPA: SpoIIE family protein phosphatase [Solirubrobacteraceae bacterium]|nr:SpoIIE family protein phosphatase [Solirubrobacteraceae bacterium]